MEQLLRFLTDATQPGKELSAETFRAGFFHACLSSNGRKFQQPRRNDNFALEPWLVGLCANALPLSPRAAELLRPKRDAFSTLTSIFQDKAFRTALRTLAGEIGGGKRASQLIRTAAELPELGREPPPPAGMSAPAAAASPVAPPPPDAAKRPPAVRPTPPADLPQPILAFWDRRIIGRNPKELLPDIGHLISALTEESLPQSMVLTSLRAVVGSPERIVLPLLYRAFLRGEVKLHPELVSPVMGEVARVLASFSAHGSALRLSGEVLAQHDVAPPERRLPIRERTQALGFHALCCLRAGRAEQARQLYKRLMHANPGDPAFLVEYFHTTAAVDGDEAREIARTALLANLDLPHNACLAFAEFFVRAGSPTEAMAFLGRAARRPRDPQEHLAGAANLALRQGDRDLWFALLQGFGEVCGMPLTALRSDATNLVFGFEGGGAPLDRHEELVSVIMTSFDAAATVEGAVRSVLAQRGCNVEIIIVDDASADDTREVIARLAAEDPRVRPVFSPDNNGTYAAKNHGISIARGEILAFHDSDDWMHPMKLHSQLSELKQGFVCTTSQWLRMRADGHVVQRRAGGYAHINPASTMFRPELVERIGPFDAVRVGADAEYLNRIRLRFGWNSISQMTQCLALGLHHEASLTQSGATAFDEHRYSPLRVAYTEAWLDWHFTRIEQGETVALFAGTRRDFEVPQEILA